MCTVIIVGSEEELTTGLEWFLQVSRQESVPVHLLVPGTERKTLVELARRRVSESLSTEANKVHASTIVPSVQDVLRYARTVRCTALVMVYRDDDAEFQQRLFEESRASALWIRPSGPPPAAAEEAWAMFRTPSRITATACQRLLGFFPASTLGDSVELASDDLVDEARNTIEAELIGHEQGLVLFDVEHATPHNRIYRVGLSLLKQPVDRSVALVNPGDTLLESLAAKIRHWSDSVAPAMEREERIELAQDLQTGSQPNLEFLGLISASAMLASFGLLQNSASVIIGAMLIAPLMTPILGAGLALTQGNRPLFQSAVWTILLGFFGALGASCLFGWLYLVFHEPTVSPEMWARCRPSPLDFCVGMVGGIAASYARTRSHLSSALAGAAIAAALVPPIATAGLQLAFWQWEETDKGIPIVGPLLLVSVNVLTIMIGSSFVLWARGMRPDRQQAAKERWVPRMLAMLTLLVLLIMIWTLHPFPSV